MAEGKRIFNVGKEKQRLAVSLQIPIHRAIEQLENERGDTKSDIVAEAMEFYLKDQMARGLFKPKFSVGLE